MNKLTDILTFDKLTAILTEFVPKSQSDREFDRDSGIQKYETGIRFSVSLLSVPLDNSRSDSHFFVAVTTKQVHRACSIS